MNVIQQRHDYIVYHEISINTIIVIMVFMHLVHSNENFWRHKNPYKSV